MKKLSLRKEILLVVAVIAITFALSTSVFATSTPIQIPVINTTTDTNTTNTTNTVENTTTNTAVVPTTTNTTTNTTVAPTTNTSGSTYENTLPQTGDASDYAIFALIGLCVVVAVVAYRKARNYNV